MDKSTLAFVWFVSDITIHTFFLIFGAILDVTQTIPESLTARLLNLIALDVHSNQIKALPNSIGCLSKLKTLNVSGNFLVSLPKSIQHCRFHPITLTELLQHPHTN